MSEVAGSGITAAGRGEEGEVLMHVQAAAQGGSAGTRCNGSGGNLCSVQTVTTTGTASGVQGWIMQLAECVTPDHLEGGQPCFTETQIGSKYQHVLQVSICEEIKKKKKKTTNKHTTKHTMATPILRQGTSEMTMHVQALQVYHKCRGQQ